MDKSSLAEILTGRTTHHLVEITSPVQARLHAKAKDPLLQLASKAQKQGFDLQVSSSFRAFDHQLKIWNAKARGERPLLDAEGKPLDYKKLKPKEIVFAILRWSALPGTSRHHWGTDLDVFDAKAVPSGYQIQLIPSEVAKDGMFGPLHEWLDKNMESHGFFRPYDRDRGGVSPERWHVSYRPIAEDYLKALTPEIVRKTLENSRMDLVEVVLSNLDEIFKNYIRNIAP